LSSYLGQETVKGSLAVLESKVAGEQLCIENETDFAFSQKLPMVA